MILSIQDIKSHVAAKFNVTVVAIEGREQGAWILLPRHIAVYLAYKLTRHSYPGLGKSFNRDQSTVRASVNKIRDRIEAYEEFSNQIKELISTMLIDLGNGHENVSEYVGPAFCPPCRQ